MTAKSSLPRVAYSPGEFAALFGKSQTWGYRQIYAGKVKAITEHGRILIPAAEVEAILKTAGIYDGIKQGTASKREKQRLVPFLQGAWEKFILKRRKGATPGNITPRKTARSTPAGGVARRREAIRRLKKTRGSAAGK